MQNHDHRVIIQKLLDCALACEHCATACLHEEDVKMMANCISLDRDCADICVQGARLLQRDSVIAHQYLVLCEEICRLCAAECSKHQHDHCQECAKACIDCAEACHAHHEPITQDWDNYIWLLFENSRQKAGGSCDSPLERGEGCVSAFDKSTAETHPCHRSFFPAPSQEGMLKTLRKHKHYFTNFFRI